MCLFVWKSILHLTLLGISAVELNNSVIRDVMMVIHKLNIGLVIQTPGPTTSTIEAKELNFW